MAARGRSITGRIRHWYGANPLHLLALLAAFALAGYAVRAVIAAGQFRGFALWFAVAIIGHDLLLFPLYSLADLSVQRLLPRVPGRKRASHPPATAPGGVPGPPLINYVRIPVAFSLLLLLAFFPLILGLSEPQYHRASGLTTQPYLWRWLAVTGAMFAGSAVIYALSWRRAATRARQQQAALAALAALGIPAREAREVPPAPVAREVPPIPVAQEVPPTREVQPSLAAPDAPAAAPTGKVAPATEVPPAPPASETPGPATPTAPAANDVPPPAPPPSSFDVWNPARPAEGPGSADPP